MEPRVHLLVLEIVQCNFSSFQEYGRLVFFGRGNRCRARVFEIYWSGFPPGGCVYRLKFFKREEPYPTGQISFRLPLGHGIEGVAV